MKRSWHATCAVRRCTGSQASLHRLPASEETKGKWLHFIYEGNVPEKVAKNLLVCAKHFLADCFSNLGQYEAGLASKLHLKDGAVPTIHLNHERPPEALTRVHHVTCQTDAPQLRTVGTQLSTKTLRPHYKSTATQTTMSFPDGDDCTSQPRRSLTLSKRPVKRRRSEEEEDAIMKLDCTCDASDSVTTLPESADVITESSKPAHKTSTYIVYESCLLELFKTCPVCGRVSDVRTRRIGTFLCVEQRCTHCESFRKWNSQPVIGSSPVGNIQLCAAVYATGASFFNVEKIFRAMRLKSIHFNTFRRHSRMYIEPAVVHSWKTTQDSMLQQLRKQQNVVLAGDARTDSPGRSVKYSCYTVMALKSSKIIDVQLVQSNDVGESSSMETEGLDRSLNFVRSHGVTLESIVTRRRPQVRKLLQEDNIKHYYDVRHIEKGLSKKLQKISHLKECEKLQKWICSIKNHIYWTAASSSSGQERVAKWTSILNHIQDIHTHEHPAFPQCLHPQRTSRDKSKWLRAGTPAFCRLKKLLTNKRLLKDVEKLNPHHQTSSLEAFYDVTLHFAPKNAIYPYLGMLCRLYLAALHFNENVGRPQATTAAREPLFTVNYPKYKKGQCSIQPAKANPTFYYVDNLLDLIFDKVVVDPSPYVDEMHNMSVPDDVTAQFEKLNKL